MISSSSSTTRSSASPLGPAMTPGILLPEVLQFAQLALDLLLHVQPILALALSPFVSGDDQLSHFLAQPLVVREGTRAGRRLQQLLNLRVDVERLLPAGHAAVGAGLDHLPDLFLPDRRGDRGRA